MLSQSGMRVGLILNTFPELSETFLIHQIAALLDGGHQVTIFADTPLSKPVHETVGQYGMLERTRYLRRQLWGAHQAVDVPRTLLESLGTSGLLRCLNVLRYGTGVLRFRALHALRDCSRERFDVLHCHYASIGWAFLPYRDVFRVPFVTSFHGDHYKSFGTSASTHLRALFRRGDAFIANGRFTSGELRHLGCPPEKIHLIPAVVSDEGVEFHPRSGGILGPDGHVNILCVARLRVSKGLHVAMEAVARLRAAGHRATLTIIGDGIERHLIEADAVRLGVADVVTFAGWLTQRDVFAHYRTADIVVLPSVGDATGTNESQGVVLQEAMLHGVPVVASAIGGVPESVDDGAAGLLFPSGDAKALTEQILMLVSHPDATLDRVHYAAQYVRKKYLKPAILQGHERVYAEALARYTGKVMQPVRQRRNTPVQAT
jgi:colanic acid/amylovoran biosynthesis glycosyltransferase